MMGLEGKDSFLLGNCGLLGLKLQYLTIYALFPYYGQFVLSYGLVKVPPLRGDYKK